MKTILVATDYSRSANNALEYAAALAKGMEASLLIFNAFNLATPQTSTTTYLPDAEDMLKENRERLQKTAAKLSEAYGITVEVATTTDLFFEGLNKLVKKYSVDLVVLGVKGNTLLSRLFGSTAKSIINEAKCPVLLVPKDAAFRGVIRILFACNYQYLSKNTQLNLISEIAAAYKAKVQILHVEQEEEFIKTKQRAASPDVPNLEVLLSGIKHDYKYLRSEDILEGIERGVEDFHADLLVMIPHKPGFWESITHPSLTKKMVMQSHVPLLALPATTKHASQKAPVKPVKVKV